MLIKSIELVNFRIFAGNQLINFSTSDDKNVTVIMGDNGSGKTTLAQAFSWCLYGKTTFKRPDELLSFSVRDSLDIGKSETVKVTLTLIHNKKEYRITRFQEYRKDSPSKLRAESRVLSVSYKNPDGQNEFIEDESAKKDLINEIIPNSISSYFFFDGERVERMGEDIQNGRSKEFKTAVDNLLGLSAISEALRHLKGGSTMVIGSYNKDYNSNSDSEYQKAERIIQAAEERMVRVDSEIVELEEERVRTESHKENYRVELEQLKESKHWAEERVKKRNEVAALEANVEKEAKALMNGFGRGAWDFFINPLMRSAIAAIDNSTIEVKEAPSGVTADTIREIIERKECLCGSAVEFNSNEYKALSSWLEMVPPEHIGAAISNYRNSCELVITDQQNAFVDEVTLHIANIRRAESDIDSTEGRIEELDNKLASAKDSSAIERNYQTVSRRLTEIEEELSDMNRAQGMAESEKNNAIAARNSLTLNDETNKRIRRDREYAEWIYEELNREHAKKEMETREDLEEEINAIFREFFDGSLQLELDEKYNVRVRSKDDDSQEYEIETSEGQTVAVIFAFIAGVIRLATDVKRKNDEMLITESYPLVMDAPMSKLDKKRIAAICEVVPKIAEQTVIMIKDTEGDLAREYLSNKIGIEYAVVSIEPERQSTIVRRDV